MLTGVALGIIITLLCLYILFLRGAVAVLVKQNKVLEGEQSAATANLGRLAAKVQSLQQPFEIHFTDDMLHALATKINDRVVRLYEAKQAAEIQKLN